MPELQSSCSEGRSSKSIVLTLLLFPGAVELPPLESERPEQIQGEPTILRRCRPRLCQKEPRSKLDLPEQTSRVKWNLFAETTPGGSPRRCGGTVKTIKMKKLLACTQPRPSASTPPDSGETLGSVTPQHSLLGTPHLQFSLSKAPSEHIFSLFSIVSEPFCLITVSDRLHARVACTRTHTCTHTRTHMRVFHSWTIGPPCLMEQSGSIRPPT